MVFEARLGGRNEWINGALESKWKSKAKEAKDMKRKGQIKAVFRIRVILIRIRIFGYIIWITDPDPDPALFDSIFQDANKNEFFSKLFCLILTVGVPVTCHKEVTKQ